MLSQSLLDGGHSVHIVTAVGHTRKHTVEQDITALSIPCTRVQMLVFNHPSEAPVLKTQYCKQHGIQMFIDDRSDICAMMMDSGIVALQMTRERSYRERHNRRERSA